MAVRKIIRMGHPTLRKVAQELSVDELASENIKRLVKDLTETLEDYRGVGLAAPQVNESIRLVIIEIQGGETRYGHLKSMPLTVFANPSYKVLNDSTAGSWEGCLSVPGLRGYVERPQSIQVSYQDLTGASHQLELNGFMATVFQHEFDHLDGLLYLDRMTDMDKLVFEEELSRHHQ
ncbi:MAG: peptide deformylase [Pseudomonadales bacterium]|nr:peptide deformylase [Pseudomonadales bacterium]